MADKPQLFSGARGLIKYKNSAGIDVTLAIATDISINVREQLRPSYVIGELGPLSIEPLSLDVDCSIGRLVPVNVGTVQQGATPNAAPSALPGRASTDQAPSALGSAKTAIDLGLEERLDQILSAQSLEIAIYDKVSGGADGLKTVSIIKEARFTGRSMTVSSGDVAQERLNFVGIWDSSVNAAGEAQPADETGYKL
jgi:hypothetical protein